METGRCNPSAFIIPPCGNSEEFARLLCVRRRKTEDERKCILSIWKISDYRVFTAPPPSFSFSLSLFFKDRCRYILKKMGRKISF